MKTLKQPIFVVGSTRLLNESVAFSTLKKAIDYVIFDITENADEFDFFLNPHNGEKQGSLYTGAHDSCAMIVKTKGLDSADYMISKVGYLV